jgi:hypothetical protein
MRMSDADVLAMVDAYAGGLMHLDDISVRRAITELVLTERWIPTIAQIVSKVSDQHDGRKREGGEAWGDALAAIRRHGYMRTPGVDFEFNDPLVASCVRSMGWSELCNSENIHADRARFIELYAQLADGDRVRRSVSKALPGSEAKQLPSGTRSVGDVIRHLLGKGDE